MLPRISLYETLVQFLLGKPIANGMVLGFVLGFQSGMQKLRFLVSLTTSDNDQQIEQAQSYEEAACKFGVELQVIQADNDAIAQSTPLPKVIQAEESHRPNAIIFEPIGGTAPPQVAPSELASFRVDFA